MALFGGTTVNLYVTEDSFLNFDFEPDDTSMPASVELAPKVYSAAAGTDLCMAHQLCLEKLGDGSEASFELRNSNAKLLQCLDAWHSSAMLQVSPKCPQFNF